MMEEARRIIFYGNFIIKILLIDYRWGRVVGWGGEGMKLVQCYNVSLMCS